LQKKKEETKELEIKRRKSKLTAKKSAIIFAAAIRWFLLSRSLPKQQHNLLHLKINPTSYL
jgi:hypothetical protein